MLFPLRKNEVFHWLLICLCFGYFFIAWSTVFAESSEQKSDDEIISFLQNKSSDKLSAYIKQANESQLNKTIVIPYGQGEFSLLTLVIQNVGDKKLVRELLEQGAKPDGILNTILPPLVAAIEIKRFDIVKLLLEAGANPAILTRVNSYGSETLPLFYKALKEENLKPFVEMAIDFKPELIYTESMREGKVMSYLSKALNNDQTAAVVSYLLTQGEDVNKVINKYEGNPYEKFLYNAQYFRASSPESIDIAKNRQDVFNLFVDELDNVFPSARNYCSDPLYIVQSDLKTLELLLDKGLDPNSSTCPYQSHLSTAAELGYIPIFKALLDAGGIIEQETVLAMIKSKHSNDLIEWVSINNADTFKQCKAKDCSQYLKKLIENDKTAGVFSSVVNELLITLSGKKDLLNSVQITALKNNNIVMADRLLSEGVNPLDEDCDCQQDYWSGASITQVEARDWLITNKVNPFAGNKPLHDIIRFDFISASQLSAVLSMATEGQLSKQNLDHWLTLILEPMRGGRNLDYVELQQHLMTFASYSTTLNTIVDENGNPYLPQLINTLIKNQDSHSGDLKLLWLLAQGAEPSEGNKEHYIDNAFLVVVMDRVGKSDNEDLLKVENEAQATALVELINDRIGYGSIELINALLTSKIIPVNKAIGLKTEAELESEKISRLLYACHYASYNTLWEWLKTKFPLASRLESEVDIHELKRVYQACTATDLILESNFQAPVAKDRQDWFKSKYHQLNFAVQESDTLLAGFGKNNEPPNNAAIAEEALSPVVLSKEELTKIQSLLAKQLDKVNQTNANTIEQTLSLLIRSGGQLPDSALETFLLGTDLYYKDIKTFSQLSKQLVIAGADPTESLWGTGYSFMEHLPINNDGQMLYAELYKTLSLLQKMRLWDALPARFIASVADDKIEREDQRLVAWFMISIGVIILLTLIAILVSLIFYLLNIRKHSMAKRIVPTWMLQSSFWAGSVLLVVAIIQATQFDVYGLSIWSIWMQAWLLICVVQLVAIMVLFKRTMLEKQYHAFTFFASFLFFLYTLVLPVWLALVAEYHDIMYFPHLLIS